MNTTMNRFIVVILSVPLLNLTSNAQQHAMHLSEIKYQIQHDVSLPLREMKMLEPGQGSMRWENGEIPNNPFCFGWKEQNRYLGSGMVRDPVIQDEMGTLNPISTVVNFDGIIGDANTVPPDPNGAVGTNYYIETVNLSFAVYT